MNFAKSVPLVSLIAAAAVGMSGCSSMTPGENAAVFGTLGGAAAGAIGRAAGMSTAESIATGVAAGAIIGATTYIIAKHQATQRQRRIAEQRARAAYSRMVAAQRAEAEETQETAVRSTRSAGTSSTRRSTRATGRATTATAADTGASRSRAKSRPAKKLPRYIAVDTEKDERTAPQAKKSVMIWDTQAQGIVGNNVYDVQSPPPVGSTARFETYSAQYVGAGF